MPDDESKAGGYNGAREMSRREALGSALAAAGLFALPTRLRAAESPAGEARPYLDAAVGAERWIAGSAIRDERGATWPADPADPKSVANHLYSGSPGVVLFYLELHAATGETQYLNQARAGADYLIATLPANAAAMGEEGAGLYTGVAGIAWMLELVRRATSDRRYAEGVDRCLVLLREGAKSQGAGIGWNASTDIISGTSGIALTLLALAQARGERVTPGSPWGDVLTGAGRRLVEVGVAERGGLKWAISDAVPRRYPNFSHGTAGVAYTLATLHGVTRDPALLDAALAGHRYLSAIATPTPNDGWRVFHSEPGGEQLFYLSWCHGPAGTARLYRRLELVTGDRSWGAYIPKLAQAIVDSGVPETHPDRSGYWNNISQCCGNCGVGEFFLSLHELTKDAKHLEFAERVARDTLTRATKEGNGLKWIQAEHRVRPELLVAQTGLMQGAAGVGLAMLHLDGAQQRRKRAVWLPDDVSA